ncbi:MAG: PadR family transcriptional regulator, partial [Chloroflexota bacterium]
HLERMRELTAVRRASSMPVALLADYALFHLEADLRWLDLTAARVDELRRTILDSPEVP